MFEKLTERARRVLVMAQEEARRLNNSFVGTEHILLGLLHDGEGIAAKALGQMNISLAAARDEVVATVGPSDAAPTGSPHLTQRATKVLELAQREAGQLGHNYIGTEHILLGIVRDHEGVAAQVLVNLGAELSRVRQAVIQLLTRYHPDYRPAPMRRTTEEVLPPGDTWSVRAVRVGRGPEVLANAYDAIGKLAGLLGVDLDDERISVTSVETTDGAGISVSLNHSFSGGGDVAGPHQSSPGYGSSRRATDKEP
jgi:hypothetical protein